MNNKKYKFRIISYDVSTNTLVFYIFATNQVITCNLFDKKTSVQEIKELKILSSNSITSPISGRVIKVLVTKDSHVKIGDPLVTIESMKMENEIRAPFDLFVKSILITEGVLVKKDEVLIKIERINL